MCACVRVQVGLVIVLIKQLVQLLLHGVEYLTCTQLVVTYSKITGSDSTIAWSIQTLRSYSQFEHMQHYAQLYYYAVIPQPVANLAKCCSLIIPS